MAPGFDRHAVMHQEETAHALYIQVKTETQYPIAAIRAIRTRYGLSLAAAKEIGLQADGIAPSLDAHQARLIPAIAQALEDSCGPDDDDPRRPTRT